MNRAFWRGKSVFITGHTGFKGAWLSSWLTSLGAAVHGYALSPPTKPSFFEICRLPELITSHSVGDVRDRARLHAALERASPEIIFHLAAQPLVRHSYIDPLFTVETNVLGTLNVLEIARHLPSVKAVINVTTDKCYENREVVNPYKECDALGGHDVYSASKACSEIISSAYRRSFLRQELKYVATARAGNVIGGGDWSSDRLIPDFFRAQLKGEPLRVRSPDSVRPWQHVLDVLRGYLMLAEKLHSGGDALADAWNFGPQASESRSVRWVVDALCAEVPGASWCADASPTLHEARILALDSGKARDRLKWRPLWDLSTALGQTVAWERARVAGKDMLQFSMFQIEQLMREVS